MVTSFSNYSGGEFLAYYASLIVAAVIAGILIHRYLRSEGREQVVSDPSELAVLTAGKGRFAEMVLARMLGNGVLEEGAKNKLRVVRRFGGETEAESAIDKKYGDFGLTEAYKTLEPFAYDIEQDLTRRELLIAPGDKMRLRFAGVVPFLFVLLVGWYRKSAGDALGEPTGYLVLLMLLTAVIALIRFFKLDPRTRAGLDAVERARERSIRLKSATTTPELGLGVALFGTAILAGTPYSQLHAMRRSAIGDGGGGISSDGGDSGGGDGGGCGGGCGGCGG